MRIGRLFLILGLSLASCDDKPPHYLVLCDARDANGWSLINTEKSNGYIMACTYQSQDLSRTYTRRCNSSGCDVQ
ncbi:hypothetical protein FHT69_006339 [Rhizobium sp. BK008]|nr:hypothetical protein [Rhizobium sp. BK008]